MFIGRRGLQSPSQLSPENVLNMGVRGWPRLDLGDPINNGLVGYWSMDGGTISGTILADLSGNGNNGTLVNNPTVAAGRIGQALSFNGTPAGTTNPYVHTGAQSSGSLNFSGPVTLAAWSYPTVSNQYQAIIVRAQLNGANNARGYGVFFSASGTSNIFVSMNGGAYNSDTSISSSWSTNVWNHVVVTADGVNIKIFLNGIQVSTVANANAAGTGNYDFGLGVDPNYLTSFSVNGFPMEGLIDDARVYNRALSGFEIQRLYSDTSGNLGLIVPTRRLIGASGGTVYSQTALASNAAAGLLTRADAKTLPAANAASAGITRTVAALKLAANDPLGFLARQTTKPIAASNAAAPASSRSTGKPLASSNAALAALARGLAYFRTLVGTNAAVVGATRIPGKLAGGVNSSLASISRQAGKGVVANNAVSAATSRSSGKPIGATNAAVGALTRATATTRRALNGPIAALTNGLAYFRTLTGTNAAQATATRATGKGPLATNAPVGLLARATAKPLAVSNAATAILSRSLSRVLLALNASAAFLIRAIARTIVGGNAASATRTTARLKTLTAANAALGSLAKSFIAATTSGVIVRVGVARSRLSGAIARVRGLPAAARSSSNPAKPRGSE